MAKAPIEPAAAVPPALFTFLKDLSKNNDKDWFTENKKRYEQSVKEPLLGVIAGMQPVLDKVSTHFQAVAKVNGGSMSRIYRDVRFSDDKTPYHTYMMMNFSHEGASKTKPGPSIYVRLEPGACGIGMGIGNVETKFLNKIRDHIVDNPTAWKKARHNKSVGSCQMWGDELKRAPKGYDPDHPLIDDIKRKAFVLKMDLTQKEAATDLVNAVGKRFKEAGPFMKFLSEALDLEF